MSPPALPPGASLLREGRERVLARRDALLPLLLILLLVGCYVFAAKLLWRQAVDECYLKLEVATSKAAVTLRNLMQSRQENLSLIAELLPLDADSPEPVRAMLDRLSKHEHVDAFCIQLPDGRLISGGSATPDYSALPPFDVIRDFVPHTSGRFPGVAGSGKYFFYQATAILREGKLRGILYGFSDLARLPRCLENELPYGGDSQLYLVDGDTGDFLMDMWHDSLGNLFDGSMGTRVPKPGYSFETLLSDIAHGKAGYFVFVSRTVGEYFWTRYQPVGINNWSIQVTVLQSIAFSLVRKINQHILILGAVVTVLTAVYLIFAFRQHRNRLLQKQAQIMQTAFMFRVQQILFEAHQSQERIHCALQEVAGAVEAEGTVLVSLQRNQVLLSTAWRESGAMFRLMQNGEHLEAEFPGAYRALSQGASILYYEDRGSAAFSPQEQRTLRQRNIRSLMMSPVLDGSREFLGVLCAVNLRRRWQDCAYLECVAGSFMMAMHNTELYRSIRVMGSMDALTGMKNRNCYEADLPGYAALKCETLHCIYIDANGLHELNNEQGHQAGDDMLRCVAAAVRAAFGEERSYRIGGDEFVAFSTAAADEVERALSALRREVESRGYHISVGAACRRGGDVALEQLIAEAESAMYADKRAYYAAGSRRGSPRGGTGS